LRYNEQSFSPEDLLHFVEMPEFTKAWEEMGLDDEDDLLALQLLIMAAPKKPPVIRGTGGLRKMRFAPPRWDTGKSGAARVCYVHFEEVGIVLLVLAYQKNERDDISERGKKVIRQLIADTRKYLLHRGKLG
jgi:hypothetical protein